MKKIIDHLLADGFLQIIEKYGRKRLALKPPITIIMGGLELFEKNLSPEEEKGGSIIFESRKIGDKKILESKYMADIPNISENPKEKYDPDREKLRKLIKFSEENCLLPITFHSHTFENFISYIIELNPSEEDIWDMSEDKIMLSNTYFTLPDILIVPTCRWFGYGLIGFYCGETIPSDFNEQKGENFRKIIQDVNGILKLDDKKLTLICGGLLVLLLIKPEYIIHIIFLLFIIGGTVPYLSFDGLPRYFSFYTKDSGKIEILLPEIDINS